MIHDDDVVEHRSAGRHRIGDLELVDDRLRLAECERSLEVPRDRVARHATSCSIDYREVATVEGVGDGVVIRRVAALVANDHRVCDRVTGVRDLLVSRLLHVEIRGEANELIDIDERLSLVRDLVSPLIFTSGDNDVTRRLGHERRYHERLSCSNCEHGDHADDAEVIIVDDDVVERHVSSVRNDERVGDLAAVRIDQYRICCLLDGDCRIDHTDERIVIRVEDVGPSTLLAIITPCVERLDLADVERVDIDGALGGQHPLLIHVERGRLADKAELVVGERQGM